MERKRGGGGRERGRERDKPRARDRAKDTEYDQANSNPIHIPRLRKEEITDQAIINGDNKPGRGVN